MKSLTLTYCGEHIEFESGLFMRIPTRSVGPSNEQRDAEPGTTEEKAAPSTCSRPRVLSPLLAVLKHRDSKAIQSLAGTGHSAPALRRSRPPSPVEINHARKLIHRQNNNWTLAQVSVYGQMHNLQPLEKYLDSNGNPTTAGKSVLDAQKKRSEYIAKLKKFRKPAVSLKKLTRGLSTQIYSELAKSVTTARDYESSVNPFALIEHDSPQFVMPSAILRPMARPTYKESEGSHPEKLPTYEEAVSPKPAEPTIGTNRLPRSSSLR
ncbi:hypothetical protein KPG66_14455 [Mycetohabitans sp. B2]|nr:hypothetical protein [Mycetohabitans sp. B2]